ncbi:NADH dehydrogenase ubiquinone 1 beta subcomplex subunit 2 [Hondaea fermentalgiana]|uniref:NADH dehydrogenase ubiquinone 1 beta subcomplex subunit 2 n=1 Tax=Hondaea fermentalgiana TaxID=2315210 RepID=A0A2R5H2V7_9STRA|nr:NADH dehydrogenase ubiquinone 1 beta subcomplex subunit 2 [Hondaea fermentalgiana]|eukprot:GBG34734.1 NADH dehydrogenase ubiquinone 1 beta subcomplex subunit 2 [Hondaea fermentalgiana]
MQQQQQGQVRNAGTSAGPEYNHFKVPHVEKNHQLLGEALGCMTWLWIFYRAKQDGVYLLGLQNPFEGGHGDHGHDDHGHDDHGHGHKLSWTKEPGMKPELQEH